MLETPTYGQFQRKFIAGATAPGIDTAALSIARGNGKSALAAYLLTRALTPATRCTFRVVNTCCALAA